MPHPVCMDQPKPHNIAVRSEWSVQWKTLAHLWADVRACLNKFFILCFAICLFGEKKLSRTNYVKKGEVFQILATYWAVSSDVSEPTGVATTVVNQGLF